MLPPGPLAFYGVAFLVVIAGAMYDRVSRGRIHNVYRWGGGLCKTHALKRAGESRPFSNAAR